MKRRNPMKINRALRMGIGAIIIAVTAAITTGCSNGDGRTTLEHSEEGILTVGIGFDQPGLGQHNTDGTYEGFDVAVATYVAQRLGVRPEQITFEEAPAAQRETLLENGQVDFVVATYSITDERKKRVDFAGPYYVAGQKLLVKADNTEITGPETMAGKIVCSVKGSTSAKNIETNFPDTRLESYDNYSLCLEALNSDIVDAVTTDDIVLAGYASQSPGRYKVVGEGFTTENYGVAVQKGDQQALERINDAIETMIAEGAWDKAFQDSIGRAANYPTPEAPRVDRY